MSAQEHSSDWRCEVLDLVYAITSRWMIVMIVMAVAIGIGYVAAAKADPFYRASATIVLLPREKPILDLSVQSASVETSEDAAKRSSSATLALPPNPDLYTTLIRSANVIERVSQAIGHGTNGEGSKSLETGAIRAGMTVESTDEGVITISMEHPDPKVAADVVNALVHECEQASKAIERQLILQQSGFLGSAIAQAEQNLIDSRIRLEEAAQSCGVSDPEATAARSIALLRTINDTENRLERELTALLAHRTERDPAVVSLSSQLDAVRLSRQQTMDRYCGSLSEAEYAGFASRWRAIQQDITLRQDLLMSMRARHELFSIRADQPAGSIAVIRVAYPPAAPAGPSKRKYLILATIMGGLVAGVICVLSDQLERVRQSQQAEKRLASIIGCFRIPRSNREPGVSR